MEPVIKKKRGRKPKNHNVELVNQEQTTIIEKKKRGRKKKYEIENFEKILNRDLLNNFNHNIAYSDDDEANVENNDKQVKKISFGNLDITVSKQVNTVDDYRNNIIQGIKTTSTNEPMEDRCGNCMIDENEYSDEEKELPMEAVLDLNQQKFESYYKNNKKYISSEKDQKLKRFRIVTTLKNTISEDNWPSKTKVCCWWCCHQFNNTPCTLPLSYDSYKNTFTFTGIFCSWNCTKAYNFNKNDHKKFERGELITLLVKKMYGITSAITIKSAPFRECLKMFGGYMTIEEFRNDFSIVDEYQLNLIKFRYVYPEITEVTNINVKSNKNKLRISRN
jgi:hypothetical protein